MIYDSLLIFAVLFLAVTIVVVINQGEAIVGNVWLLRLYLLLTVFTYYAYFWKKSGQTLGMRVWKIRIVTESGSNPGWAVSYPRLLFALLSLLCFGLGYLWRLFTPYTWHDRLSHTRIINISSLASSEKKMRTDAE
jgi:uncharacterized RDD family membrane protein YckC